MKSVFALQLVTLFGSMVHFGVACMTLLFFAKLQLMRSKKERRSKLTMATKVKVYT